jgi:deoxycytidine triphosphate deaminase
MTLFGILNKSEIHERSLQATSYDLRLGAGHCIYDKGKWVPVWISENQPVPKNGNIKFTIPTQRYLTIEPFGAALIQLKETIDLKRCADVHGILVCGRFDLKLALVKKGLISQQATQVEPLYYGKLFCYLFNMTGNPIDLREDERTATIEFNYVSCRASCNENIRKDLIKARDDLDKEKYQVSNGGIKTRIFCNDHGIEDVRYFLNTSEADALPTHGGLSVFKTQFDELKKAHGEKLEMLSLDKIRAAAKKAYTEDFNTSMARLEKKIDDVKGDFKLWVAILAIIFTLITTTSIFLDRYLKYLEGKKSEPEKKSDDLRLNAIPSVSSAGAVSTPTATSSTKTYK